MFKIYSRFSPCIVHNVQIFEASSRHLAEVLSFSSYNSVQNRKFRAHRRTPIRVVRNDELKQAETFDEYYNRVRKEGDPRSVFDEIPMTPKPIHDVFKQEKKKPKNKASKKKNNEMGEEDMEIQPEASHHKPLRNLQFRIYDKAPEMTKKLLKKIKSKQALENNDTFIVEGWRLLADSLNAGLNPKAIFYSRSRLLGLMAPIMSRSEQELVNLLNMYPLYKTPYKTMQMWSSLTTSPGVAGVFSISEVMNRRGEQCTGNLPLTVILDEIRDPSNVGSILRTLASAGVDKVLFTKGCSDPFETKCLRASAGSLYKLNFELDVEWKHIAGFLPEEPTVYLADSCKENDDPDYFTDMNTIDLESESKSDHVSGKETVRKMEYLNSLYSENQRGATYELNDEGKKIFVDTTYEDEKFLNEFSDFSLPNEKFLNMDYYNGVQSIILVIGGETGLSDYAKKFCFENNGIQVSVPMVSGMNSLNSAVATGIIVYDMLRNYKLKRSSIVDSFEIR